MALEKQIWLNQLMNNFYPDTTFLKFTQDFSSFVENDKLNMTEVGIDPAVLINNTSYPIKIKQREDKGLSMELDLYETENTLIREPHTVELSYDKLESVIYGHRQSLRTKCGMKSAHAFSPSKDTDFTPIVKTTGEVSESFKRMLPIDILKLKRRFDELDINPEKRQLVIHPRHLEDLIMFDLKAFKDLTEFRDGKPSRFAGFNIMQFSKNPTYNLQTNEKNVFGAEKTDDDTFCSFAFSSDEVMKADGDVKMYIKENDPEERATIIGFDKRFVALPIRNKGVGAIITSK